MGKNTLHPYTVKYRYIGESVLEYQKRLREHGMKATPISRLGHIESMNVEARNKGHAKYKFRDWFAQVNPNSKDYRRITAVKRRR